jgi:hypothetical protein
MQSVGGMAWQWAAVIVAASGRRLSSVAVCHGVCCGVLLSVACSGSGVRGVQPVAVSWRAVHRLQRALRLAGGRPCGPAPSRGAFKLRPPHCIHRGIHWQGVTAHETRAP